MLIKFSELSLPFGRLAPGAVLLITWEWITGRVGGTWTRPLKSYILITLKTILRAEVSLKQ